jgi:hypothetical protein
MTTHEESPPNATPMQTVVLVPAMVADLPLADVEDMELAYKRVEPELLLVAASDFAPKNVDILAAATTVLAFAPRILERRDQLEALILFDIRYADSLTDYAKAAIFAHLGNQPTTAPEDEDDDAVIAEVIRMRAIFLTRANTLVAHGTFDAAAVANIRKGLGHRAAAGALVALVQMFRERLADVQTVLVITEAELERGAQLGAAAFKALSRRERQPASKQTEAALRARRAWTLLDRAYTQCRRAITYLRFDDGDADAFAPTLRRNRGPAAAAPRPATTAPPPPTRTDDPTIAPAPTPAAE